MWNLTSNNNFEHLLPGVGGQDEAASVPSLRVCLAQRGSSLVMFPSFPT